MTRSEMLEEAVRRVQRREGHIFKKVSYDGDGVVQVVLVDGAAHLIRQEFNRIAQNLYTTGVYS